MFDQGPRCGLRRRRLHQSNRSDSAHYPAPLLTRFEDISIALSPSDSPLKAVSRRSQAPYFFVQRLTFFVEPRRLRFFWRIGAAQLVEHFSDREFSYFSHRNLLYNYF
jgi:hypothetical protein